MQKRFLLPLIIAVIYHPVFGQQFNTGTNLLLSIPQKDYKDVVGDVGYGLGGYMLYSWKNKPFKMGAQISYLILGSATETINVNGASAKIKSTSNAFLVTFLARLQRQKGFFRPYAEGVLGFQNLNSQITSTTSAIIMAFRGDTQFLLTYGAGLGTWIALRKPSRIGYIGGFGKQGMFLDLRVNYLTAGKADYFDRDSITVSGNTISVAEKRVATGFLMFTLGLIFAL